MREIKFRCFNSKSKEMLFDVGLIPNKKDISVSIGSDGIYINPSIDSSRILMQFTGFYDKKGVEIYEGDIFRVEEDGAEDGTDMIYYLVIVWIKEWGMFGTLRFNDEYQKYLMEGAKALDEPMFWTYTLEDTNDRRFYLDGNIYQNPKILVE